MVDSRHSYMGHLSAGHPSAGRSPNGALAALKNLNRTNQALDKVQNRLATGLIVSGNQEGQTAGYAVAEGVRADLGAYHAVSKAISGGKRVSQKALAAAEEISDRIGDLQAKITEGMSDGTDEAAPAGMQEDLTELTTQFLDTVSNASCDGVNLLDPTASDQAIVADLDGTTLTVRAQSQIARITQALVARTVAGVSTATQALSVLATAQASISTALGQLGADLRALDFQDNFIATLPEAQDSGLRAIADADLARESAKLQALRVRQQLGSQSFGIVNQAPQTLLSLFR